MANWEPGNPKGWGDPGPLVLAIILLVILGAALGSYGNFAAQQQRCQQLLQQGGIGQ
jgi:hypothetical protein